MKKWHYLVPAVVPVTMFGLAAPAAMASQDRVLYVAPNGSDSSACTATAPCATITHALEAAGAGNTVLVAPGVYAGQVTITKRVNLEAERPGVLIDATGATNGIAVGVTITPSPAPVGNASGSVVRGFTIENATQEGIVALGKNLVIEDNVVAHNDLGAFGPNPTGECAPAGPTPGDCGEGIHLGGVMDSLISGNYVTGNAGGILVSDEFGPTAWNHITGNTVVDNVSDCGITLAGHNGNAISPTGQLQPKWGGVYRNVIANNTSSANGAAGVGLFAGGPGSGVYRNQVLRNDIEGNGLPGVAMHTHTPDANANGNQVVGNWLSDNGIGNAAIGLPPGDPGTPVTTTTDIDVVSDPGATPITNARITGNHIANVTTGIWIDTSGHVQVSGNTFRNVMVPVQS